MVKAIESRFFSFPLSPGRSADACDITATQYLAADIAIRRVVGFNRDMGGRAQVDGVSVTSYMTSVI